MSRRDRRADAPRSPTPPSRRRPLLGEDSWLEIVNKLVTIGTLGFGIWIYFHSVQPVFEKEEALARAQRRVHGTERQLAQMAFEGRLLQQQLKEYQAEAAAHRHGIVLGYLIDVKGELQRQTVRYQRTPERFDLRDHALAYLEASIQRLGSPAEGSIGSYHKEALEIFQRYVEERVPAGTVDGRVLDGVLDDYDRREQLGGSPR